MCSVTAGIAAASAAASGYASYAGSKAQAEATEAQMKERNDQIETQAAAKARDRAEKGRAVRARLRAGAGESGVSGPSVEANYQESLVAQSMDIQSIRGNAERDQEANATGAQSSLAGNNPEMSLVETGLRIGGIAANDMENPNDADATYD